jgi:hypothetical protein
MKNVKEGMGKAFGSLVKGDIRGAVKGVGAAFKGVNVGVLAGAAAVMAFTMAWKGVAGVIDEIGAELGAVGVTQFRDDFVGIFEETAGWNVSIKEAMSGIRVLSDEFGVGFDYAEDLVGKTKELALSLGMSQAEAAKVMGTFMTIGGLTADQAVQLSKQTELLAVANDVAPAGVMKDVAENTEFFAKYGKDGGKNIAEAAVQAKKLGSNLGTVEKVMSSLLDFQTSLESEMEASILLGREINLQKARELALNNDIDGAMAAVLEQVGTEAEWNELNAYQRDALAKSIGVGTADMAKFIAKQNEAANASKGIESMDFTELVGDDALSSFTKFTNSMKEFGAILLQSFIPYIEPIGSWLAGMAQYFTENEGAAQTLKSTLFALGGVLSVLAVKSIASAIAGFATMIAKIGASSWGIGIPMALATVGGVWSSLSNMQDSATAKARKGGDISGANGQMRMITSNVGSAKKQTMTSMAGQDDFFAMPGIFETFAGIVRGLSRVETAVKSSGEQQIQDRNKNTERTIAGNKENAALSAQEAAKGIIRAGQQGKL